jgi:hypothetical protein
MKPNFLFIGPDKTGSSWMYEVFKQHPNCYVPQCKDIYFFDRYYSRGLDWYFLFFQDADTSHLAVGELSHDYLFSPIAARRIKNDLPDVKLLTCLRHPVDRTFSHYLFMIRSGRTQESFESALENYPELINNSLYYKHLNEYFNCFEKQQIKVLLFQDLKIDSVQFSKQIFDFLNVPFVADINYSQEVLSASKPRSFAIARLAKTGANLARDLGFTNTLGRVKQSKLTRFLYKPLSSKEKPKMTTDTVTYLLKAFRQDTLLLQDLLQTDLSDWLIYKH